MALYRKATNLKYLGSAQNVRSQRANLNPEKVNQKPKGETLMTGKVCMKPKTNQQKNQSMSQPKSPPTRQSTSPSTSPSVSKPITINYTAFFYLLLIMIINIELVRVLINVF